MFRRKLMGMMMAVTLATTAITGCGNATGGSSGKGSDAKIVIYSNADDEAITAMQNALDNNATKINIPLMDLVHQSLAVSCLQKAKILRQIW